MTQETGNFKSKLFGGFDRQNVIDYIEDIAAERSSLQRENDELHDRILELEEKLAEAPCTPECEKESDVECNTQIESAEETVKECQKKCDDIINEARNIIDDIRTKYDTICRDIKINVAQAECELSRVKGHASGLNDALKSASEKLGELSEELEEDPVTVIDDVEGN